MPKDWSQYIGRRVRVYDGFHVFVDEIDRVSSDGGHLGVSGRFYSPKQCRLIKQKPEPRKASKPSPRTFFVWRSGDHQYWNVSQLMPAIWDHKGIERVLCVEVLDEQA